MSKRISKARARAVMREVVAEAGPDHSVSICNYTDGEDHPDTGWTPVCSVCIIGKALDKLGVPLKKLYEHEGQNARAVVPKLFPDTTTLVVDAMQAAQTVQDNKRPWSEALQAFEDVMDGKRTAHDVSYTDFSAGYVAA